jgi:hypothetical protein
MEWMASVDECMKQACKDKGHGCEETRGITSTYPSTYLPLSHSQQDGRKTGSLRETWKETKGGAERLSLNWKAKDEGMDTWN